VFRASLNISLASVFMDCRDKPGNDLGGGWQATLLTRVIPEFAPPNIRDRRTRTVRCSLGLDILRRYGPSDPGSR